MVDTPRTIAELKAIFADNASGDISAQDMRDFVVSVSVSPTWGFYAQDGSSPIVPPATAIFPDMALDTSSTNWVDVWSTGTSDFRPIPAGLWVATVEANFYNLDMTENADVWIECITTGSTPTALVSHAAPITGLAQNVHLEFTQVARASDHVGFRFWNNSSDDDVSLNQFRVSLYRLGPVDAE